MDKTLEAVGDIICGNDISTVNGININNCEVPFTTYLISTVTEHNGSRQINILIKAKNAFLHLYFNELASHVVFIKEGNSYSKRNTFRVDGVYHFIS